VWRRSCRPRLSWGINFCATCVVGAGGAPNRPAAARRRLEAAAQGHALPALGSRCRSDIGRFGRDFPLSDALLVAAILLVPTIGASLSSLTPRVRACIASVGLLSSSAILVHLTHGLTESHFHFFVMLAVITLYRDWLPFLLAAGFVVLHHGVFGLIAGQSVYGATPRRNGRPSCGRSSTRATSSPPVRPTSTPGGWSRMSRRVLT